MKTAKKQASIKTVKPEVTPQKKTTNKNGASIRRVVHASMKWLSLIILGALALEGAKTLVKGDPTVAEALAGVVVFLLFYIHLT